MEEKKQGGKVQKSSGRREGHNTAGNPRAADEAVKGNKGARQQGNHGSRQGAGGNRGKRGNTGLG